MPVVTRRFEVDADGVCIYGNSLDPLWIEPPGAALPVFARLSVYRLVEPSTRLLARKLEKRGVFALREVEGDQRETHGRSLRLMVTMFGDRHEVRASGQVHGEFARVLHLVNAHVPPGEPFLLPGMIGDAEPSPLRGVPAPVEDAAGALAALSALRARERAVPEHALQTFALAVRVGDRDAAEQWLDRWILAAGVGSETSPFGDERLGPTALRQLLPR